MYRARVEAVSGLKVRAGGKWLTCIGNRNIKVGDLIWTDGRCVYGYEQTPQQPFVITAPEKWGIPVFADNNTGFTFAKNNLEYIGNIGKYTDKLINTKNAVYAIPGIACNIDTGNNIYQIFAIGNGDAYFHEYIPIGDTGGAIYERVGFRRQFLNIDEKVQKDDIYEYSRRNYQLVDNDDPLPNLYTGGDFNCLQEGLSYISVKKNGESIFDLDIAKLANEKLKSWYNPSPRPVVVADGYIYYYFTEIQYSNNLWGFIENENRWFFTVCISCWAEDHCSDFGGGNQDIVDESNFFGYDSTYYFDSTGKQERIFNSVVKRYEDYYHNTGTRSVIQDDFGKAKGIKFILQDGYYFYMTDFFSRTGWGGIPECAKYEIYSPDDKLIFSDWFKTCTYLTIHQLKEGLYLVGVGAGYQGHKYSYYVFFDKEEQSDIEKDNAVMPQVIQPGIYIYNTDNNEDKLIKIDEDYIDESNKSFLCWNQFLRPMKKYKHWWENIQTLD